MAMTNREEISTWLANALSGSALLSAQFERRGGSLNYRRECGEVAQQFRIVFDVGPRYEPAAVAHVLPQIVLESSALSEVVRRMTNGDDSLMPGDTSFVLRHQLQNLAPKESRQQATRWYIHDQDEVPVLIAQIKEFLDTWAMPFLDRYQDLSSLVQGYEAGDERLHLDRRFYLYVAAACVQLQQPRKAMEVLEKWFGRPASRKQYARVFQYVEGQLKPG
jgi:hypothetical protein